MKKNNKYIYLIIASFILALFWYFSFGNVKELKESKKYLISEKRNKNEIEDPQSLGGRPHSGDCECISAGGGPCVCDRCINGICYYTQECDSNCVGSSSTPTPRPGGSNTPKPTPCVERASVSGSITAPSEVCVGDVARYTCEIDIYYICPENQESDYSSSNSYTIDTSKEQQLTLVCANTTKIVNVKNCFACYRKLVEQTSDYSYYEYHWTDNPSSGYEETNISQEDCNSIRNVGCESNTISQDASMDTTSCSGTFELYLNEQKNECTSSISGNYYSINCIEKVTSIFNPGKLSVKIGQGFRFNVSVKSEKTCSGDFNSDAWNNDYNRVQAKINKTSGREQNWYNKLKTDLINIVNEYKKFTNIYRTWNANYDTNNPKAALNIDYKYKKSPKSLLYDFENANKTGRVLDDEVKNTKSLANGDSVVHFIAKIESTVDLIPPRVYLDYQGNVVNQSSSQNKIDGGNLFLSDLKSDEGEYNISIIIDEIGNNKKGKMINNQCTLKLEKDEKKYRIISVSNPFDISSVTPGTNWVGVNYNFRNVIDKDIWGENSLYEFDLSQEKIKQIKDSNSRFFVGGSSSAYLGLCNQNVLENDPTNSIICDIIK